ncbi:SAV_2336 N-terminal domain-related protein [Streptomyces sp. NPDC050095]|uniref:SAV_2336 N-terminal domain-related protein n=1 Tax=unclassified Streptomyces TaxID=2593676 RepID=UPI00342666DB
MRSELARLAAALTAAADGTGPTPTELAELLWLAGQLTPPEEEREGAALSEHDADERAAAPHPEPTPHPAPRPVQNPPATPPAPGAVPDRPPRIPLYLADEHETGPAFLTPAPPMLRHPLPLQRALRPLKRRVPSPTGTPVLDENATVDRIARLAADPDGWVPVLRPAPERWLRLALVHDTGPTMPVWNPLLRELHAVFAQSGVFRTLTVHAAGPDGRAHDLTLPQDGRTAVLLLSDCTGPQWHTGPAATRWRHTLHTLGRHFPLAVLQPLPERLWRTTALPATPGRLSAPHPAAPLTSLRFTPYDAEERPDTTALPVPVLEADPRWLANWSRLIGSPGGAQVPGAAAYLNRDAAPPRSTDAVHPAEATPEELVLAFRSAASPEAFRLAGHLAVGVPHLPVMRLIHTALEADPRPSHLAEIIVSGMLTEAPGPPGSYAFRPGVRELLLRSLPRTARGRTTQFLAERGQLIADRAGMAPGEFTATTRGAEGEEIAAVDEATLTRLSGGRTAPEPAVVPGDRYRLMRRLRPDGTLWEARDEHLDGQIVVVQLYEAVPARGLPALRRMARTLHDMNHPNVVRVHDFAVEDDTAYLVMEHLDGIPLDALAAQRPLPARLLADVAKGLGAALLATHDEGMTHGDVRSSRAVLLPDGTVKLTQFSPQRPVDPAGLREDVAELADVLRELGVDEPVAGALESGAFNPAEPELRNLASGSGTLGPLIGEDSVPDLDRRRYHLFGPPRVMGPGWAETPLGSPTETAVLCALLRRSGRHVSRAQLAWAVWGEEQPVGAAEILAAHVARLRASGAALIAEFRGGWAAHTSTDRIDLDEWLTLFPDIASHREAGNPSDAREQLGLQVDLSLAEFTGTPLDGVPGPGAAEVRDLLTELRIQLLTWRIELDLTTRELDRAGDDIDLLSELAPDDDETLTRLRRQLAEASAPAGQPLVRVRLTFTSDRLSAYQLIATGGKLTDGAVRVTRRAVPATDRSELGAVLDTNGQVVDDLLAFALGRLAEVAAELVHGANFTATFWPEGSEAPADPTPAIAKILVSPALITPERARDLGLHPVGEPVQYWARRILTRPTASTEQQLTHFMDELLSRPDSEALRDDLINQLDMYAPPDAASLLDRHSPARAFATIALLGPGSRAALRTAVHRHAPQDTARLDEILATGKDLLHAEVAAALSESGALDNPAQRRLCGLIIADLLGITPALPGRRNPWEDITGLSRIVADNEDGLRILSHLLDYTAEDSNAVELFRARVLSGRAHDIDDAPAALQARFRLADTLRTHPALQDPADRDAVARALATDLETPVELPGTGLASDALALAHAALSHEYGEPVLTMLLGQLPGAPETPSTTPTTPDSLVRGPLPLPTDGELPAPTAPDTVLVYALPDGSLTTEAPGPNEFNWVFYEVDVHAYTYELDGTLSGARATVRVDDPLEAVRKYPGLHLPSVLAEELSEALTSARTGPNMPFGTGPYMPEVAARLARRQLPGHDVRWTLPDTDSRPRYEEPGPDAELRATLTRILTPAECFLIGFEGPLARLYPRALDARAAARELIDLAAELRDPDEALSGTPLRTESGREATDLHPLDVLRAFAREPHDRRVARALAERLDAIELRALRKARPTQGSDSLIGALNAADLPTAVVSDASPHVVSEYLDSRSLSVRRGAHGRADDPTLLMPHPDVLRRALHQPGSPTLRAVLIGSSVAELTAARALGLSFIGYAPSLSTAVTLEEAGAGAVVRDLALLTEVVRERS